jgi:hypothetical protein
MDSNSNTAMPRKNVLFLVSLPRTPEFDKYQPDIRQCAGSLEGLGVTVYSEISERVLRTIHHYDVVVVVSHLDEDTCELVLSDSRMDIATFVNSLPEEFDGILDFSSCYSAQWIAAIKAKCQSCHVLGAKGQTTLPFRLYIYPYVMQVYLGDESVAYHEAYVAVQEFVKREMQKNQPEPPGSEAPQSAAPATKLGKKHSTVYAPSSVVRGEAFMVQLFLHDESESTRKITLQAKRIDPNTRMVDTQELSVKLKKGDKVAVKFSTFSAQPDCFMIDEPVKIARWDGKLAKFQFNVIVSEAFKASSFVGKLMIEVDHEPVGDCSFNISVSDRKDDAPVPVQLTPRDMQVEGEEGRLQLKQHLQDNMRMLLAQWERVAGDSNRADLKKALDTCQLCIQLVENPVLTEKVARPKKVFVSSTCEAFMAPFRESVRQAVAALKMEPEMCDDWPQTGCNPTHVCCQKVLDSDIYLGVFGGRYGYVEPSLDSSMTQVEYLTALSANKTMLLFVLNPLNETDEPESAKIRQNEFINNMKQSRILRTFTSAADLYELTKNDLLDFISKN